MDFLIILANELDLPYDEGGRLASEGQLQPELLQMLDANAFFAAAYPKSLSNQWVQEQLVEQCMQFDAPVVDLLRTATEHIAGQIVHALAVVIEKERMQKDVFRAFATGGGALNDFLIKRMREKGGTAHKIEWILPEEKIIQFKEAALMGLMGVLRVLGHENVLQSVTGARRNSIGGMLSLP